LRLSLILVETLSEINDGDQFQFRSRGDAHATPTDGPTPHSVDRATVGRGAVSALAVLQALQRQPVTTAARLVKDTGLALATVNRMLMQLIDMDIVSELTQRQRNRVFSYRAYVDILNAEL